MDDSMSAASTIQVIHSSRGEHRSRGRRGVDDDVLARGVAARDAIHAANERTAAYKHELDTVRVALGRAEDHIKDIIRVTPGADRFAPAASLPQSCLNEMPLSTNGPMHTSNSWKPPPSSARHALYI